MGLRCVLFSAGAGVPIHRQESLGVRSELPQIVDAELLFESRDFIAVDVKPVPSKLFVFVGFELFAEGIKLVSGHDLP
jgi:hypothetical protein